MNRKLLPLGALVISLVALTAGCTKLLEPNQIMELNRNGKWSQAAAASAAVIRGRSRHDGTSFSDVSQAYFQKAYAELRLGKKERARSTLRELDSYLDGRGFTAATRWLYRETRALRRELSMPPEASRLTVGTIVGPVASKSIGAEPRPETAKELAAYLSLCRETGAVVAVVVTKGRVLATWYLDPEPQLYDAGSLSSVFEDALAFTQSTGGRVAATGVATIATLREEVLKPAHMEDTKIAASDDGSMDPKGPVYTTPGDLVRFAIWLKQIGYFARLHERRSPSPWREMQTPKGQIALGRNDTFVAIAGDLIVVRFQQLGTTAGPRFQREAAPLLAGIARIE